jgi:hypothetical protein
MSRTALDSIETLFLEIAVRSREAGRIQVPSRRKNSGGGMPAANGRLIDGAYRIVNAANAAYGGQISCPGVPLGHPFGLKIAACGAIAGICWAKVIHDPGVFSLYRSSPARRWIHLPDL